MLSEKVRKHLRRVHAANTTHGQSKGRTYSIWCGIKNRCLNKNSKFYLYYGGRGIQISPDWIESFENFLNDMGEAPAGFTLDRTDNNKGYCKENCRWASRKEQMNNRRCNIVITFNGESRTAMQWSELLGIPHQTISERFHRGLSPEKILSKEWLVYKEGLALGGKANGERNKAKTHCPHGHEYTKDNIRPSRNGGRSCRTCHRIRESARRELSRH